MRVAADIEGAAPAAVAQPAGGCDPVDPAACLLPFPNDYFTAGDLKDAAGSVDRCARWGWWCD